MQRQKVPQLICPAGSLRALRAAVDHGADAVYLGNRKDTNLLVEVPELLAMGIEVMRNSPQPGMMAERIVAFVTDPTRRKV